MKRLLVLAVAVIAVITVTAVAPASRAQRSRTCTRHLLQLAANSIGPASAAALRSTRPSARPRVVSAALATDDRGRCPEAKFECGTRVWRRTVVVYITLRAYLPSASLSGRVVFVGRFKGGLPRLAGRPLALK